MASADLIKQPPDVQLQFTLLQPPQLGSVLYAQSAAGAYYVAECLLGKAPGTLAATIKTEDVANAEVVKGMLSAALGAV